MASGVDFWSANTAPLGTAAVAPSMLPPPQVWLKSISQLPCTHILETVAWFSDLHSLSFPSYPHEIILPQSTLVHFQTSLLGFR